MKIRLLHKLRVEALRIGCSDRHSLFMHADSCKLKFPDKTTFYTWFSCKFMNILWYKKDGFCSSVRHKYRKYTRRWKSAHGVKLGINSEKPFLAL